MRLSRGLVLPGLAAACCAHQVRALPEPATGVDRIVFVGDSLVNRSAGDHGFLAMVRARLETMNPGLRVEVVNAGVNGDTISEIRDRLARDVLPLHAGAVVLYWDSDAVETVEDDLKRRQVRARRAAYEGALRDVLETLKATDAYLVVAGPTLYGERRRGQNSLDHQLDAYEAINRRVCAELQIDFVDTRHAAFQWLSEHPAAGGGDQRQLTDDGEHLSSRGVELVADEITRALEPWAVSRPRGRRRSAVSRSPVRAEKRWLAEAGMRSSAR
jgi:lysophospholipase L1-like esterase